SVTLVHKLFSKLEITIDNLFFHWQIFGLLVDTNSSCSDFAFTAKISLSLQVVNRIYLSGVSDALHSHD
ncbi:MAG: hypothetical protein R3240_12620, partial [Gammaproteobacteria bacterium]|nr:hypothetical protein [Gammaproteobacteria bacterium]